MPLPTRPGVRPSSSSVLLHPAQNAVSVLLTSLPLQDSRSLQLERQEGESISHREGVLYHTALLTAGGTRKLALPLRQRISCWFESGHCHCC